MKKIFKSLCILFVSLISFSCSNNMLDADLEPLYCEVVISGSPSIESVHFGIYDSKLNEVGEGSYFGKYNVPNGGSIHMTWKKGKSYSYIIGVHDAVSMEISLHYDGDVYVGGQCVYEGE